VRKPHISVSQAEILRVARDHGEDMWLDDLANYLNIHSVTCRRKCDGLVAQGKLKKVCVRPTVYRYVGAEA